MTKIKLIPENFPKKKIYEKLIKKYDVNEPQRSESLKLKLNLFVVARTTKYYVLH